MIKPVIAVITIVCIGLTVSYTAPYVTTKADKDNKTIEATANKQIAFEKVDPAELDQELYQKNDFLSYLPGYNYWKTPEGYIFIISGGPAGTPGHGIFIDSVEEDKEGRTIITVEQSSPPEGEVQVQVVTFPRAVYSVHAANEKFIVKTKSGAEYPRYPQNEFAVTGTVADIITLNGILYPPHYLRVIPDVEGNRMNGIYFDDYVQFDISNAASEQAEELNRGDKVSIVYEIEGMSNYNVKSVTKLENSTDSITPDADQAVISSEEAESTVEYLCRKPDIDVNAFHEQKYDLEVEGVKYYYFDILYGLAMAKSPELGDDDILPRAFVSSKDKSIYRAVKGPDDKWGLGGRIGEKLQASDFEITYDNLVIKPGMEAKDIINRLGNGSADEDNNYGFTGWSGDNKYKYYRHEYGSFSIYTKVNIIDGTSIVSQISLNDVPTERGVRNGSPYRDLLRIYGAPAYDEDRDGKIYSIYKYHDFTLTFGINGDKIIDEITMTYENRQKENNSDSTVSEEAFDDQVVQ